MASLSAGDAGDGLGLTQRPEGPTSPHPGAEQASLDSPGARPVCPTVTPPQGATAPHPTMTEAAGASASDPSRGEMAADGKTETKLESREKPDHPAGAQPAGAQTGAQFIQGTGESLRPQTPASLPWARGDWVGRQGLT